MIRSVLQIRHRVTIPLSGEHIKLRSTKGYIMLSTTHEFALINVTLAMRAGPRIVMIEPQSHLSEGFGYQVLDGNILSFVVA